MNDNKAGTVGNIGTQHVARADPDSYTLLMPQEAKALIREFLRVVEPLVCLQGRQLTLCHQSSVYHLHDVRYSVG